MPVLLIKVMGKIARAWLLGIAFYLGIEEVSIGKRS